MKLFHKQIKQILVWIFISIAIVIALMPIYWLIISSIKRPIEYFVSPPVFFPKKGVLKHYINIFFRGDLSVHMLNSFIIAFVSSVVDVFIGSLAAYGITRFKVGGKYFSFWILSLMMFPPVAIILPTYMIARSLHVYDTRLVLIVVYSAFNLPFAVWMLNGFFQKVPLEIDDSAQIDGCSRWKTYLYVILPLASPGLIATAIFCFIFSWNEFIFALILTSMRAKTIPVNVAGFIGDKQLLWGPMSATGTVLVVPVLAFSLIVQRHLVRGMTFGAIKG
jgi:multiple sugar transport system permease protein